MLEKEKLRKADIFSGGVMVLFGLWIVRQALKMPMKDSWGGVQNVWFVSPALFPLMVGATIAILGVLLVRTALKSVGQDGLLNVLGWLSSPALAQYLKTAEVVRFYAMAVLFFSFIFLNLPRIDFFLCSVLFLAAFISMFYFDDDGLLQKLLIFYIGGTVVSLGYFILDLPGKIEPLLPYPNDWFTIAFILIYLAYAWHLVRRIPALRKKYRTGLILSVVPPFVICPIFKYFLLVPMPSEGLVVAVLDALWYWDF